MGQMPEIKGVVNKEPERDKKKAGLLARLFGGGAGSGTVGVGGFGGAASGGLLATKAGLLALILAGTTVAGGIGVVGYRLFGPGQDQPSNGENLQLFAPKPKDAPAGSGQDAAKDGTSTSLQYLSQANASKPGDASASAAPTDATAANAAGAAATAGAAGSNGPLNKVDPNGGAASKLLKNSGKLAGLSAPGGGGGGAAAAGPAPKPATAPNLASSAQNGTSTAMRKSGASAGGVRAMTGRSFGSPSAMGQAFGALGDNHSAGSSAQGGTTYDGAAGGGSTIGGGGSPIGMPGAGTGSPSQPTTLPGAATPSNPSSNIPTPPAADAAPWAKQLQTAEVLIGIAAALLLVSSMINKTPTPMSINISKVIGGIVCMIGLAIIAIGASIAKQYGQTQFGLMGLGVGGVLIALGVNSLLNPPTAAQVGAEGGAPTSTTSGNALTNAAKGATVTTPVAK